MSATEMFQTVLPWCGNTGGIQESDSTCTGLTQLSHLLLVLDF